MRPFKAVSSLLYSGLALALSAGALSSAEAAVYRGKFTPDYGAPFPNLYWDGTIEVVAPDSCIPGSAQSVFLSSCSGMTIAGATVNLYEVTSRDVDGNIVSKTFRQTMNFAVAAGSALQGLNWLLDFGDGQTLEGARSTAFPAIQGNFSATVPVGAGLGPDPAWFSLQFLGDFAQLYWFDKEPGAFLGVPDELILTAGATVPFFGTVGGVCRDNGVVEIRPPLSYIVNPDKCGWSDPDGISTEGAFITFERVPEPATLALVPMALGAMGFASLWAQRRRRSLAVS